MANAKLTPRQRETLLMAARGMRDRDIACRLKISEDTVAFHIAKAVRRLGAMSRTHALWLMIPQMRENEKPQHR